MSKSTKAQHLEYGEGQRENYGEGAGYRPEDKTPAAEKVGQSDGFAGGKRPRTNHPDENKPDEKKPGETN
jgi:hypothetical protein